MYKILTVDDSPSIRKMVVTILGGEGYDISEAENGIIALDKIGKEIFDLILVDLNMPGMDGMTLLKSVRNIPTYKFTPILIVSTESSPTLKEAGFAAGVTGWVVKPLKPDKLLKVVKQLLG